MKYLSVFVLLVFSFLFSPSIYANKVLYIQSTKAKILDRPNFSAKSISELLKGKKVQVVNNKPNWVQVKTSNHQGWVAAMLLAPTPPLSKPSIMEKLKPQKPDNKSKNIRRRASMHATAAATRGLRTRLRTDEKSDTNYQDLSKVESRQVNNNDAWNFHKKLDGAR